MKLSIGNIDKITVEVNGKNINIVDLNEADYSVFIKAMQQLIVLFIASSDKRS